MSILTNPVTISVIVLCVLSLLKLNVLLAMLVACIAGGLAGGIPIYAAKGDSVMSLLTSGFSGNATTALAYILLGTFATAIATTGLADIVSKKLSKIIGTKKLVLLGMITLIACLSQNLIPIHIAYIPILIPPMLVLMNKMRLDRRAVACCLAFGHKAPYIAIPFGFGLIFQTIISEDPDGLRGVNQEKMAKSQQAKYPIIKGYRDQIENKYQWCIAAVPGEKWAKKLFPELRASQAVEKLWEAILKTSRVTDDPIKAWEDHNRDLHDRCEYLNKLHIRELRYKSSNGTDFTVGMIPEAQFCGGGETSLQGIFFNPNIPTEECFISPMRGVAEGIVYATKPLSYQGQLISGFWIRFHEGKAVEWHAEENNELLTKLIEMDEGSRYLGECALVPFDSPINQTGLLFYNTLFDENACCHLALGMGFADTIRDFQNKTLDECRKLGVNDSMIHEDFMIGSADLSIDAVCEDGKTVAIFRNGTWAF